MVTAIVPATVTAPEPDLGLGRRVVRLAGILVALGAFGELLILKSVSGAVSLTAAGGVAIINFRWLEAVLNRVIQPGRPRFDRRSVLRILGRLGLLGVLFAAVVAVPHVDAVAVAVGFSTLVVALVVEGIRWDRSGEG